MWVCLKVHQSNMSLKSISAQIPIIRRSFLVEIHMSKCIWSNLTESYPGFGFFSSTNFQAFPSWWRRDLVWPCNLPATKSSRPSHDCSSCCAGNALANPSACEHPAWRVLTVPSGWEKAGVDPCWEKIPTGRSTCFIFFRDNNWEGSKNLKQNIWGLEYMVD